MADVALEGGDGADGNDEVVKHKPVIGGDSLSIKWLGYMDTLTLPTGSKDHHETMLAYKCVDKCATVTKGVNYCLFLCYKA